MKPPNSRRPWSSPLADFVAQALDPALAKQGFGQADVVLHWEEIVGPRLAAVTEPLKIQWPPRPPKRDPLAPMEPGALVLRVEGAFALEVQHAAQVIAERVNAHLGWRCVGRLLFRQGPVRKKRRAPRVRPAPSEAVLAEADRASAGLADEELRKAVSRLGAAVLAAREDAED